MTKKIWLDYFPPGQTERGIWSKADSAPSATAFEAVRAANDDLISRAARVRHVKRGGTYAVLGRGKVQTDTPLADYAEVVAYRSEDDGMLWVRPVSEFEDGRFDALPAAQVQAEPVAWGESYDGGKFFHTVSLTKTRHHTFPFYDHPAPTPPAPDDLDEAVASLAEFHAKGGKTLDQIRGELSPAPDDLDARQLRKLAADFGAYVRENASVPDILNGGWKHPFSVTFEENQLRAFITALRARPATVQVKPLVWELEPDRDAEYPKWTAETDLEKSYHVFKAWWGAQDKWAFVGIDGFYHSEADAKAAAQADYEARIRAALAGKGGA